MSFSCFSFFPSSFGVTYDRKDYCKIIPPKSADDFGSHVQPDRYDEDRSRNEEAGNASIGRSLVPWYAWRY